MKNVRYNFTDCMVQKYSETRIRNVSKSCKSVFAMLLLPYEKSFKCNANPAKFFLSDRNSHMCICRHQSNLIITFFNI